MRKSMADSITTTMRDLNRSGLVNDITMKNIEKLCLPEYDFSGKKGVRGKYCQAYRQGHTKGVETKCYS